MPTYTITTSNWDDPAFWSAITETTSGAGLDFAGLPSSYTVDIDEAAGRITITDGATTFTIGDDNGGGTDVSFGAGTVLDFFTSVQFSDGTSSTSGGILNDSLTGGAGNDTLSGGAGNDTIDGGSGADSIDGGTGNDLLGYAVGGDTLLGGEGDDTLRGGFSAGTDDAELHGGDGNDRIITYGANDTLFGGAGNDTFAADSGDEYIDGGAGNDIVYAQSGNDTILAGSGNDSVEGGDGDDSIIFADGFGVDTILGGEDIGDFDVIDLSSVSVTVTVDWAGAEAGTIVSGADTITFSEIEQIILTDNADGVYAEKETASLNIDGAGGNDALYGGGGADTITGGAGLDTVSGSRGTDSVSGGAGNDVVAGGSGSDSLSGDDGADVLRGDNMWLDPTDYASTGGAATNLTVTNSAEAPIDLWWINGSGSPVYYATINPGDTLVQPTFDGDNWILRDENNFFLEIIQGAPDQTVDYGAEGLDDTLIGGDGNDSLYGELGDDVLQGGAGNDNLYAATGNDNLSGGIGNDALFSGRGNSTLDGGADDDFLEVDSIDGGVVAIGGTGNDTLDFDTNGLTGVTATFNGDNGGTFSFSGGANGTFAEIEDIFGSTQDDTIDASADNSGGLFDMATGDDSVIGGSGADTIFGDGGSDTLRGGGGADSLAGGSDGDSFLIDDSFGADTIIGGETTTTGTDHDRIDFSGLTINIIVTYSANEAGSASDLSSTLTFSEIETLTLTDFGDAVNASTTTAGVLVDGVAGNDTLTGGSGADTLRGGDGDDSISGGAGNDFLKTGQGQDTLDGGDGDDTLMNAAGDDSLVGGAGDDLIVATQGSDTLVGGAGNDTLMGGTDGDSVDGGADDDLILGDLAGVAFNGTGTDGVAVASGISDFPTAELTVEVTFASDNTTGLPTLFSYAAGGEHDAFRVTAQSGSIRVEIDGVNYDTTVPESSLFDGNIHTLGVTWDSATGAIEVFVDGVSAHSGVHQAGATIASGGTVALAQDQDSEGGGFDTNQSFDGTIYGVRLYDGIRTPAEIQDTVHAPVADTSEPNLVANWVADANSASFTDLTGSHAMTMSGDVTATWSSGNDTLLGGDGADTIYGGGGDDSITGGDGADTLISGDGQDTLLGGLGNDSLVGNATGPSDVSFLLGGAGGDTLDGTGGIYDVAQYYQSDAVNIDLTDGATESGGEAAGDTLIGIEQVDGSNSGNDTIVADNSGMYLKGWGGSDSLIGGTSADTIEGGEGDDYIEGGDGDDLLTTGLGQDTVMGGAGNDTLMNSDGDDSLDGGTGDDSIVATGGEDTLRGGSGADTMDGGVDADTFIVEDGFGNDVITGGEGTTDPGDTDFDTIDLSALSGPVTVSFTGDEAGTITDGTDTITFSEIESLLLTDQADSLDATNTGLDHFVDGKGGDDTLIGGYGDHTILGGDGADEIYGGSGDSSIDAGTGDDTVYANFYSGLGSWNIYVGGTGSDTFVVDGTPVETYDYAINLTTGIDNYSNTYSGFETVMAGDGDDTLTGDTADNLLSGGDGSDTFNVLDAFGNDTIIGNEGGTDDDTLDFSGMSANGITITYSGAEAGTATDGTDTLVFSEVESLTLTDQADSLDATATGADIGGNIDAGAGDDTISLGDSAAVGTLNVGAGDNLVQMSGSATITENLWLDDFYSSGNDTLTMTDNAQIGNVNVDNNDLVQISGDAIITGELVLENSTATVEFSGNARLTTELYHDGDNAATISFLDNSYFHEIAVGGNLGYDITLNSTGMTDIDTGRHIYTGTGADTITLFSNVYVDEIWTSGGADTITVNGTVAVGNYLDAGSGDDRITVGGSATINEISDAAGNDTITLSDTTSITTEVLGGTGDDAITIGDNVSIGTYVDGEAGADTIISGTGDEDLRGGDDGDRFILSDGFGTDTITGGEGTTTGTDDDTLDFSGMSANGITITYSGAEAGTATDGTDTLVFSEIEAFTLTEQNDNVDATTTTVGVNYAAGGGADTLIGGSGGDTLAGGDGDDYIEGGDGDDLLTTGLGQDTLMGGAGNDTLMNSDGDDSLDGGAGDDSIVATGGEDTLRGGTGADTMEGGDDADTFIIEDGFGNDVITGGEGTTDPSDRDFDTIDLSALSGPVTVTYTGSEAGTITDGTDTITFSQIESLILTNQRDIVNADADSADGYLDTGGGNDQVSAGSGNDTIVLGEGNDFVEVEQGDSGTYSIDGGAGNDTLQLDSDGVEGFDLTWTSDYAGNFDFATGGQGSFTGIDYISGSSEDDTIDAGATTRDMQLYGFFGNDSITGGAGNDDIDGEQGDDTVDGGAGDDFIDGSAGDDLMTGGAGDDRFFYNVGDGADTITDFNTGNSGALGDGDTTNNDFINLSSFYDNLTELRADFNDDGVLNQSNDGVDGADYSDNSQMAPGDSLTFQGANQSSFTADNTGVVCFTRGTAIRTPRGDVLIEELRVGDLVTTMDNGPQRIRWIGRRAIGRAELAAEPRLRPILIRRGLFGARRNLLVSRQHCLLTGDDLARAIHLTKVPGSGIRIAHGCRNVEYIHLMFDAHEIIFAENVPSESFYPGPYAFEAFTPEQRTSFVQRFPEFEANLPFSPGYGGPVRAIASHPQLISL